MFAFDRDFLGEIFHLSSVIVMTNLTNSEDVLSEGYLKEATRLIRGRNPHPFEGHFMQRKYHAGFVGHFRQRHEAFSAVAGFYVMIRKYVDERPFPRPTGVFDRVINRGEEFSNAPAVAQRRVSFSVIGHDSDEFDEVLDVHGHVHVVVPGYYPLHPGLAEQGTGEKEIRQIVSGANRIQSG